MTVIIDSNKATYTGNGSATDFPFAFKVLDEEDLQVYLRTIATEEVELLGTADYTVNGVPGAGSITYNPAGVPLPATHQLILLREVELTQEMDIENQGGFFPDVLEDQLDRIVMQIQQVSEKISRAALVELGMDPVDAGELVLGMAEIAANVAAAAASASAASDSASDAATTVSDFQAILNAFEAVSIGTVTTLAAGEDATVENVGTEGEAILNFGIPAGETGPAGPGSGDVNGPASSTNNAFAKFDGTSGNLLKDGATKITIAELEDGDAVSVIGRAANSAGAHAAIAAAANDRLLARTGNALSFVQLTIGMIPDALITFAKLATAAIATTAQWRANTADKLLTTDIVWSSMAEVALTETNLTTGIDLSTGYDFAVTLTASRTMGNFSNVKVGQRGRIRVTQNATGGWVVTKASNMKTPGGTALSLPTAASAEGYIYYDCVSATKILLSHSPLAWS